MLEQSWLSCYHTNLYSSRDQGPEVPSLNIPFAVKLNLLFKDEFVIKIIVYISEAFIQVKETLENL